MKLSNHMYHEHTGSLTLWVVPDMSDWSVEVSMVCEGESFVATVVDVVHSNDVSLPAHARLDGPHWLALSHVQDNLRTWWLSLRK